MSSTYRLICVSHNPALVLDQSWSDHLPAAEAAKAGLEEHPSCRLLIGRWSAALIEVGCPRMAGAVVGHPAVWHPHETQWVDVGWLRLMALSPAQVVDAGRVPGCWTRDIAQRLAASLGIEVSP